MDTSVHEVCDRYVDDLARLDPTVATMLGIAEYGDRLPDLSPAGHAARADVAATALAAVAALEPIDDGERAAKEVFVERIGIEREIYDAGLVEPSLDVLMSPAQTVRRVFDLMPTETIEDWDVVARRMSHVPTAISSYIESLRYAAGSDRVAAARQVRKVAEQCAAWAGRPGTPGYFDAFVRDAPVDSALRRGLDSASTRASQAYGDLARFLRDELLRVAPLEDAVGEDTYELWSRAHLGASIDVREAYEWGWEELSRIEAEVRDVVGRISPGASLHDAAAKLDHDPNHRIVGVGAFRDWLQRLSDRALAELRGVHFEIPDAIMRLDCRIAPPGGVTGAYYTPPSADLSRPGTMWWSLPEGTSEFSTWREVTVVYHEGVPGHHLQIATATHQSTRLNRFQRSLVSVPGYSEGWALYAERLMCEFGYLNDDAELLGMLSEALLRAARVIVDIGMHLRLKIPRGTKFHEGATWTPELGLEFMRDRTILDEAHLRDEIDRYLGWPGQAPAYKLGERLWLATRDDVRAQMGPSFDLASFHMHALRSGQMGMDTLRRHLVATA